jgi:hypothetical protein
MCEYLYIYVYMCVIKIKIQIDTDSHRSSQIVMVLGDDHLSQSMPKYAVVPVPHHSKFFMVDKETNIKLTGTPDQILQRKDNGYSMVDYKSAIFTSAKDSLSSIYKVQLNAYALIAESIGLKPVR